MTCTATAPRFTARTVDPRYFTASALRRVRQRRGLSIAAVSRSTYLSEKTLRAYEAGARLPSHGCIRTLADFYRVTLDVIYPSHTELHACAEWHLQEVLDQMLPSWGPLEARRW